MVHEEEIDLVVEGVPLTSEIQDTYDPLKSGLLWYVPPSSTEKEHKIGGHEWVIAGSDMQVLTMTVPGGETILTETGSFMFMAPHMETEVELTLCTKGGCSEGCNRIWGGESCVKVSLINNSSQQGYVGLTPNFPAKIIPVKFGTHVKSGEHLIANSGAYMSHLGEVDVGCDFDCGCRTCLCAGLGCCRQKITASDGSVAFLAAGGTIMYRSLEENETITVDSRSVVAYESTASLGITPNGRFCTCLCGGEGIFSTTLTGPGRVYLQSYGLQKFAAAVTQTVTEEKMDRGDAVGNIA